MEGFLLLRILFLWKQIHLKIPFIKNLGFTPCKTEQPQGMELQVKEAQKQ